MRVWNHFHRVLPLCLVAVLAVTMAGCGSDTAEEDTDAPAIDSSNLEDGAQRVSILIVPSVTLTEAVDISQINESTVILKRQGGVKTLAGAISYDEETFTISFDPVLPLDYGITYELTLAGIEDEAGNSQDSQLSFTTYFNNLERVTRFSGGVVTVYYAYHYDENDRSTWYARYSIGGDGLWFTADDVMAWHGDDKYDEQGSYTTTVYNNTGADKIWFTADDVIAYYNRHEKDDYGNYIRSYTMNGIGADGIWYTADDVISSAGYYDSVVEPDGKPLRSYSYNGAGSDGLWFTADDTLLSYSVVNYDEQGFPAGGVAYSGSGSDGLWETGDDVVSYYYNFEYNSQGLRMRFLVYTGVGADGQWFTADDVLSSSYSAYEYDDQGNRTTLSSLNAGSDGIMFTEDDEMTSQWKNNTSR